MGFFDKVSSVAASAMDKGKEAAETAKINLQINSLNDQIKKVKFEIGNYIVENKLFRDDDIINSLFIKIEELQVEIEANKAKLMEVKNMEACPACGAAIEKGAKFCNQCGAQIPAKEEAPEAKAPEATADAQPVSDNTDNQ